MGWTLVGQGWTLSNTSRGVHLDHKGPQKVAPETPETPKMAIFGGFGALVPLYGGPKFWSDFNKNWSNRPDYQKNDPEQVWAWFGSELRRNGRLSVGPRREQMAKTPFFAI